MTSLLIQNGRVVDPSQELDATLDLLIEDGVVTRLDKHIRADVPKLDVAGLLVVPGLIDLHTHLREPGQ
jgi:dihydroorotase